MDVRETRRQFAKLLEEAFESPNPQEFGFIEKLAAIDIRLNDPWGSDDRSINSAWNFVDEYFDALGHHFEDVGGVPLSEARQKLLHIIKTFSKGDEINDEKILEFYQEKPKKLRVKSTFPWIRRE